MEGDITAMRRKTFGNQSPRHIVASPPKRGAAEASIFRIRERAIARVDERFQLVDEETAVVPQQSLAASPLSLLQPAARRRVLVDAGFTDIRDRDDDQRARSASA